MGAGRGDRVIADALRMSVYFGESLSSGPDLAGDALMGRLAGRDLPCAVLLRGAEGFGLHRRIQAERLPDASTDLPLVAVAVGEREHVLAARDDVDAVVARGLVTLESTTLATGADVSGAAFPAATGGAGRLTIHGRAGDGAAAREAVRLLREAGAAGAIVVHGVDGWLAGRRGRARLFGRNADTPVVIAAVGPTAALADCLPRFADLLREPVVTLEQATPIKHDGRHLGALPDPPPGGDAWQMVSVLTRRVAKVDGRPLYSELTRRLRRAGAAGATTVLGDWGYAGDEPPHGDRLGRVVSHRPTWTTYVDRPEKVAEVWPQIDEVTAEHGLVTSQPILGYRERGR
jgi:PII-like signaling protein